jgi:hypothetical protein
VNHKLQLNCIDPSRSRTYSASSSWGSASTGSKSNWNKNFRGDPAPITRGF